jgi:hypothetical protein
MQYVKAPYFPHMRLEGLFNRELLEDVYDALAAAGNFETRANDLYLFSQSEDLRSLGERFPRIAELAKAMYSKQMIQFLSQVREKRFAKVFSNVFFFFGADYKREPQRDSGHIGDALHARLSFAASRRPHGHASRGLCAVSFSKRLERKRRRISSILWLQRRRARREPVRRLFADFWANCILHCRREILSQRLRSYFRGLKCFFSFFSLSQFL